MYCLLFLHKKHKLCAHIADINELSKFYTTHTTIEEDARTKNYIT